MRVLPKRCSVFVNSYSKFTRCKPRRNKTSPVIASIIMVVLHEAGYLPKNMPIDKLYQILQSTCQIIDDNVSQHSTFSTKKATIDERVIQTLKTKLLKNFSVRGRHK
ncbi:hypothetical protein JTB14_036898 [Gonioctena quinquepunctata]|nr:hypothetical protein JTB14_036898 [Gonioctena quinquepunctata]